MPKATPRRIICRICNEELRLNKESHEWVHRGSGNVDCEVTYATPEDIRCKNCRGLILFDDACLLWFHEATNSSRCHEGIE